MTIGLNGKYTVLFTHQIPIAFLLLELTHKVSKSKFSLDDNGNVDGSNANRRKS